MIIVLLETGCRIGEVIGLRWDDVDFDSNVININHAVGYTKEDGKYFQYIKDPKFYAGKRSIPMNTYADATKEGIGDSMNALEGVMFKNKKNG